MCGGIEAPLVLSFSNRGATATPTGDSAWKLQLAETPAGREEMMRKWTIRQPVGSRLTSNNRPLGLTPQSHGVTEFGGLGKRRSAPLQCSTSSPTLNASWAFPHPEACRGQGPRCGVRWISVQVSYGTPGPQASRCRLVSSRRGCFCCCRVSFVLMWRLGALEQYGSRNDVIGFSDEAVKGRGEVWEWEPSAVRDAAE